jgi:hypothetical protein
MAEGYLPAFQVGVFRRIRSTLTNPARNGGDGEMRYLKIALPVFLALGITTSIKAEDKPSLPAGSVPVEGAKTLSSGQKMLKPAPVMRSSQSSSGVGDFFRKLFGPSDPKLNGKVIEGARTYKNGIMPLPPVYKP